MTITTTPAERTWSANIRAQHEAVKAPMLERWAMHAARDAWYLHTVDGDVAGAYQARRDYDNAVKQMRYYLSDAFEPWGIRS